MAYCNACGVELDDDMTVCPLCGLKVGEIRSEPQEWRSQKTVIKDKISREIEQMSSGQKRLLFFELSGILLVSGILGTVIINLIVNKEISWSMYNLVTSLWLLSNISALTLLRRRPVLMVLTSFISGALFLWLLDLIGLNQGWGLQLGLPLFTALYVLTLLVMWLIRRANRRGFNLLAIVFLAIGIFLICIEIFTSLYEGNPVRLSWSIIACASILPVAALLFYVHYRLKSGIELRRFFHI